MALMPAVRKKALPERPEYKLSSEHYMNDLNTS
jgi:hypothetical protein